MTYERSFSVTVSVYMPIIRGGSFIRIIDEEIASYSHVISADGGFKSAEIGLKVPSELIDDWLSNGIGRHIVVHGPGGEIVWEGFVDNVTADMGNVSVERGRLTELCNRVSCVYTPIIDWDPITGQPVTGTTTETIAVDNEDSKLKYGIWEKIISAGTVLQEDAEYIRDAFLMEYKELEVSHSPSFMKGGGDISLSLDCKGYIEWLGNYVYNNINTPPNYSVEMSTKIVDVLTADPNNVVSTNYDKISFNGLLINAYEDKNRMGAEIINEIVSMGDVNDSRWMFGIYENRVAYYMATPTAVEYLHYISTDSQKVLNVAYGEVSPWNVRPGKICVIPDTLIGRYTMYTGIRTDPRVLFIEQVSFTAPASIELQGKKISSFPQMMAKLGLSGA